MSKNAWANADLVAVRRRDRCQVLRDVNRLAAVHSAAKISDNCVRGTEGSCAQVGNEGELQRWSAARHGQVERLARRLRDHLRERSAREIAAAKSERDHAHRARIQSAERLTRLRHGKEAHSLTRSSEVRCHVRAGSSDAQSEQIFVTSFAWNPHRIK